MKFNARNSDMETVTIRGCGIMSPKTKLVERRRGEERRGKGRGIRKKEMSKPEKARIAG